MSVCFKREPGCAGALYTVGVRRYSAHRLLFVGTSMDALLHLSLHELLLFRAVTAYGSVGLKQAG